MGDDVVSKAAPKELANVIIVAIAFATQGNNQVVLGQDLPGNGAGKLLAAIRVDNKGSFGKKSKQ